ncbi:MarR family winged helix-turn-helix transcriptional regulator [Saccharibacillus sp. JS10]|uniref:MarR family winged helix-turn-helix transcriptional regulator n=1 Tax=Saccharibacillus sp. JS10 TaxID=2950552 RepID=UPI00210A58DD|nr:MarR family transcriptional regulator [Saccharibacillus sp. JS10]MCQ4086579.1 MarR family transcriptional regulator [Saccharibacillus sp. JS10]
MQQHPSSELLNNWLEMSNLQAKIEQRLEQALAEEANLSLNEFYVLYFLSLGDEKKMRLQQLQEGVGLSQSAMSRLVVRMEAPKCGALQRHLCEDDRRGVYTEMTEIGKDKLRRGIKAVENVLHSLSLPGELPKELSALLVRK